MRQPSTPTLVRSRVAAKRRGLPACLGLGAADVARRASVAWRASIRAVPVSRAPLAYAGSLLPSFSLVLRLAFIFPAYARTVDFILLRSYARILRRDRGAAESSRIESRRAGTGRARVCAIDTLDRTGASRSQRLREAGLLRGKSERERERGKRSRPQLPVPWLSAEHEVAIPASDNVRVRPVSSFSVVLRTRRSTPNNAIF